MKAFLLAAGLGTRLSPITDTRPKCLVSIGGRPLLDIWLDSLALIGVEEVLVNTHHLAHHVLEHVSNRLGPPFIRVAQEPELLGSAGTLRANRDFVANEAMFLAVNADNLTDFDLSKLVESHRSNGDVATLAVFHTPRPKECGIVEVVDDMIVGYVEKPIDPPSDLANAGMYAFDAAVLDEIDESSPKDIGYDLLPLLVGRARAVSTGDCYFMDIGTPAALRRARVEWKGRRSA